ncbi:hypothetical protein Z517_09256 [Fonsecaea pedrosoi CBS 271.37]|uniref:SET domain-containing protein n=1 Tax=Fonsecaea pedrosoi CBS 271.37 TaxID=1442368 RepID=A0A0D2ERC9_9EURO|nr:uncharacterized protein Z517_09256 [Fonsecaea pedrosoi CBS 271.37]KIW76812.1 hypothetical protein Z517_09256 [Fonsecaea pedrosoi CBS 271.37]
MSAMDVQAETVQFLVRLSEVLSVDHLCRFRDLLDAKITILKASQGEHAASDARGEASSSSNPPPAPAEALPPCAPTTSAAPAPAPAPAPTPPPPPPPALAPAAAPPPPPALAQPPPPAPAAPASVPPPPAPASVPPPPAPASVPPPPAPPPVPAPTPRRRPPRRPPAPAPVPASVPPPPPPPAPAPAPELALVLALVLALAAREAEGCGQRDVESQPDGPSILSQDGDVEMAADCGPVQPRTEPPCVPTSPLERSPAPLATDPALPLSDSYPTPPATGPTLPLLDRRPTPSATAAGLPLESSPTPLATAAGLPLERSPTPSTIILGSPRESSPTAPAATDGLPLESSEAPPATTDGLPLESSPTAPAIGPALSPSPLPAADSSESSGRPRGTGTTNGPSPVPQRADSPSLKRHACDSSRPPAKRARTAPLQDSAPEGIPAESLAAAIFSKPAIEQFLGLVRSRRNPCSDLVIGDPDDPTGQISRCLTGIDNAKCDKNLKQFLTRLYELYLSRAVANLLSGRLRLDPNVIGRIWETLGWSYSKYRRHLNSGKHWEEICGKYDGLLCFIPLARASSRQNQGLTDDEFAIFDSQHYSKMSEDDIKIFHAQLDQEAMTALICRAGKAFQESLDSDKMDVEFCFEGRPFPPYTKVTMDVLERLQPFPSLEENHYDASEYPDWERPLGWPEELPWPTNPMSLDPDGVQCDLCTERDCRCIESIQGSTARIKSYAGKGRGLQANGPNGQLAYREGALLGQLTGEIQPEGTPPPGDYIFILVRGDITDTEDPEPTVGQLNSARMGGVFRLVSHSCKPCTRFRQMRVSGLMRVVIEATRDIRAGEEITASYGSSYFPKGQCRCEECQTPLLPWQAQGSRQQLGSLLNPAAEILDAFAKSLVGWDKTDLKRAILQRSWSVLGHVSPDCAQIWRAANIGLPQFVRPAQCWGASPNLDKLWQQIRTVVKSRPEKYSGYDGSFSGDDHSLATFFTMTNPDISKPQSFLHNIPVELAPGQRMKVPKELFTKYRPIAADHPMACNVTPTGSVFSPHLDTNRDGLIAVFGNCTKLIACWPASAENIEFLLKTEKMKPWEAFRYLVTKLSGGILLRLTMENALLMLAGTIHGTITIEGGVLIGINTNSVGSLVGAMVSVTYELRNNLLPDEDIPGLLEPFVPLLDDKALKRLQNDRRHVEQELLREWPAAFDALLSRLSRVQDPEVLEEIVGKVKSTFKLLKFRLANMARDNDLPTGTCCGVVNDATHFISVHLDEKRFPGGDGE